MADDTDRAFGQVKKDLETKIWPDLLKRMALATRATVKRFAPADLDVNVNVQDRKASVYSVVSGSPAQIGEYTDAYAKTAELLASRQEFNKVMAMFGVI